MASLEKTLGKNHKIGYKDSENNVIIPCKFDDGPLFFGNDSIYSTCYASVAIEKRCGVINEKGDIIVPIEYEESYWLIDSLFAVRKKITDKEWCFGVIDANGIIIIPFEYKCIERKGTLICCYKIAISQRYYSHTLMNTDGRIYEYSGKNEQSWFDSTGQLIHVGEGISGYFDKLIIVNEKKLGVIDAKSSVILQPVYNDIKCPAPNRFIVRREDGEGFVFGVIDDKSSIIIPFEYKYIETKDGVFYKCYKECDCETGAFASIEVKYKYSPSGTPTWMTSTGVLIAIDDGELLSDCCLVIKHENKCGVYDKNGKKIVNYLYDSIDFIDGHLIVEKDGLIGLLTSNGEIVINASYSSIECVNQAESSEQYEVWHDLDTRKVYGRYSVDYQFDTDVPSIMYHRKAIYTEKRFNNRYNIKRNCHRGDFDFEKCFVLSNNSYSELFTLAEGVISNSRFDEIRPLTNISFAINKGGKWGVYRCDVKQIIIPCDYDLIRFDGGHVALLNKDGLWGAKTLALPSNPLYSVLNTEIPIKFKEIEILDHDYQFFYGVQITKQHYKGEEYVEYTVIDRFGDKLPEMSRIDGIKSNFTFYDWNHLLCSNGEKWGFISIEGYISIPFKYDEITKRKSFEYDVRIGNCWGVLSIDGREIVTVKYKEKISDPFVGDIVTDFLSGMRGVLGEDGRERIPAIYEHVLPEKGGFAFVGYGGITDDDGNFFCNINNAEWGCTNDEGILIIPPKYDCLKIEGDYIIAGRDGYMLYHDDSSYGSDYSGVYDMYDNTGKLLIGGFSKYSLMPTSGVFMFYFGGSWVHSRELINEWNGIYINDYSFNPQIGGWIITDCTFKTITKTNKGIQYQFEEGFLCTITIMEEENKRRHYFNLPVELLIKSDPCFEDGYIITTEEKNARAIRISDGESTAAFDNIMLIDKDYFFVRQKGLNGLIDINGNMLIDISYIAFTIPVNGYFFGVSDKDEGTCDVELFKIENGATKCEKAISAGDIKDVMAKMADGFFMLYTRSDCEGLKALCVYRRAIFDPAFAEKICDEQIGELYPYIYWFSDSYLLLKGDYSYEIDNDDIDYERDTWDAMTDGMYGDMPDGFDGDYSFMGRD